MQKNRTKKIVAVATFAMIFSLAMPAAFAKSDKSKGKAVGATKSEKVEKLKDFEKPGKEKSNAKIYKEKVNDVSSGLKAVAKEEKGKAQQKRQMTTSGLEDEVVEAEVEETEEAAETLEQVAEEVEQESEEVAEAIEEVESQGGFKKFLVGTDYKNLGQLRSSLVKNRNQIRKLTKTAGMVQGEEQQMAVENQLATLTQERERIKSVIDENEGGFSLLGWVFRFINGYPQEPINEEEEEELLGEVADAVDEVEEGSEDATEDASTDDATTETGTDTTTTDDTTTETGTDNTETEEQV